MFFLQFSVSLVQFAQHASKFINIFVFLCENN